MTTLEGLSPTARDIWASAFVTRGASQCGFCTPGIIMRLAALTERKPSASSEDLSTALAAHLCRCTGWNSILDAATAAQEVLRTQGPKERGSTESTVRHSVPVRRDSSAASRRAEIEGRTNQKVDGGVAAGLGGFADDSSPAGALVAVPDGTGGWSLAGTLTDARRLAKKVQGRNSGAPVSWPLSVPRGDWDLSLETTFVEPAYLEPDASWCEPGGDPVSPVANGGAFGGKLNSVVAHAARTLAAENGMPVRVLLSREDVVRLGPKRPPIAAGLRLDGSGVVRVGRTPGSESLSEWVGEFLACMPSCSVEVIDIPGPPVSARIRGGGWAEGAVLKEALRSLAVRGVGEPMWTDFAGPCSLPWTAEVATKEGGRASATVSEGVVQVTVQAGTVLDAVVLRSYCVGAVHQALGWVKREAVAVDAAGNVLDLTIRSFGILPARDMPRVEVQVIDSSAPAVNVSEAVFAAAAASAWIGAGLPPRWPMNTKGAAR